MLLSARSQSIPLAVRKPLLSALKRKDSKESSTQSGSMETASPTSTKTGTPVSSPQKSLSIAEDVPILSEHMRPSHEPHSDSSDGDERRVQFNKAKLNIEATGENIVEEMDIADDETEDKVKKKQKG